MTRQKRAKIGDMSNEDLFSLFINYLKNTITKDLHSIYKKEARLLDPNEPWLFQLKG